MKKTKSLERFLLDKLESEIQTFGDGTTEFHTRDLQELLEIIDAKDDLIQEKQITIDALKQAVILSEEQLPFLMNELYNEIKHGDEEHQDWLRGKIAVFVSKKIRQ